LSQTITVAGLRRGFEPVFWVANTLELFERLAFYGSKAVLSFYLANKVGLGVQAAATLAGLFSGLLYSLPIFAGVLVDRFGFRRTLAACFGIFTIGYFLIGLAGMEAGRPFVESLGKTNYVIAVLTLTAVGGSLIKPCIVGTVDRTSRPEFRALGFSIYYALVNLGGAIGPLLASVLRAELGIEYVFLMSAATSALLFGGTLLFFREPSTGQSEATRRSFGDLLGAMLLVFRNFRFISFLVIFSGFWIMFWQIFYSLPFYIDEVLRFPRFEILETVDAWTIILLSVPLAAVAKRLSAMTAMVLGFLISSCSWIVIGASATVAASIAGLFVFAVGESLQAPRFYDYVGSLAPKDQVGTFMGFAFLPVAIGSFAAGPLAGYLVRTYIREAHNPGMMWFVLAGIGFVTTALLALHSRIFRVS
jgi:dipeptide/tripeptide permease